MSNKNSDGEQLIDASRDGDLATVQRLLSSQGVDVNYTDSFGVTALMYASDNCHIDCVRLLLENGANVNLKDNDGRTAKDWAQQKGHSDIVNILTEVSIVY